MMLMFCSCVMSPIVFLVCIFCHFHHSPDKIINTITQQTLEKLSQIKLAEKRLVSLLKQKKYCFYHTRFWKLKSEDGIGDRKRSTNLPLRFNPFEVENKLSF